MSRFRPYEGIHNPGELAVFRQAYGDACRKLGVDPANSDIGDDHCMLRNRIAMAVMDAAKFGERDLVTLTAYAVAVGMRDRRLPKGRRDG